MAKTPAEVAEKCDILSIHLAAGPLTKNLVNADVLDKLKPGAFVINTARADVVDYEALAAAVKEKGIRVALDVYPGEPAERDGRLHARPGGPAGRLRHAPHRRVDRPGAGGDRGRDGPDRQDVQGDRPGAERRQPREEDAGEPCR